jgi:predicted alpha/beta-hydrolase family hydrolase
MRTWRWTVSVLFLSALGLGVGGCAAVAKNDATATENLLAAAGFTMRPAGTPEKLEHLKTMPVRKIVTRTRNDQLVFTYADPDFCRCLWVGDARQYNEYQRLVAEKQLAQTQLMAAEEAEMAPGPWGMWGRPWR